MASLRLLVFVSILVAVFAFPMPQGDKGKNGNTNEESGNAVNELGDEVIGGSDDTDGANDANGGGSGDDSNNDDTVDILDCKYNELIIRRYDSYTLLDANLNPRLMIARYRSSLPFSMK